MRSEITMSCRFAAYDEDTAATLHGIEAARVCGWVPTGGGDRVLLRFIIIQVTAAALRDQQLCRTPHTAVARRGVVTALTRLVLLRAPAIGQLASSRSQRGGEHFGAKLVRPIGIRIREVSTREVQHPPFTLSPQLAT